MAIQDELKKSEDYKIGKVSKDSELAEITQDNVARIEAMISIDSDYKKSAMCIPPKIWTYKNGGKEHQKGEQEIEFRGSTCYWMRRLNETFVPLNKRTTGLIGCTKQGKALVEVWEKALLDEIINVKSNNSVGYSLEIALYGAISAVDRENGTHLTSDQNDDNPDGNGRIELTHRLYKKVVKGGDLRAILKDRNCGFELIEELRKTTKGGRENYSFATKFCHYASFYFYEGKDAQDNYSIYDDVLGKNLPEYAREYLNKPYSKDNFQNYDRYSTIIDRIREAAALRYNEQQVSRNGFDHLLWYYHKG